MPDRPPGPPLPMALLRHELEDGTCHFDLLLGPAAPAGDDERVVPTWRCDADPLSLPVGASCNAEPIAPHRGLYLRLDACRPLEGGRGRVIPVHRGTHRGSASRVELHANGRTCMAQFAGGRLRRVR